MEKLQGQINARISLTSLSSTATGLTYNSSTGVFSMTSGYTIPTTLAVNQIGYANSVGRLVGSNTLTLGESRFINLNLGSGNAAFGVVGNNAFVQAPNGDLRLEAGIGDTFANKVISISNHEFLKGIRAGSSYGTAGQVLSSTGSGVQWTTIAGGSQDLDAVLAVGNTATLDIILNDGAFFSADKFQFSGESTWFINKKYDGGTGTGISVSTLTGDGVRMVVAAANGVLSTQAIPSGGGGFTNLTDLLANTSGQFSGSMYNSSGGYFINTATYDFFGGMDYLNEVGGGIQIYSVAGGLGSPWPNIQLTLDSVNIVAPSTVSFSSNTFEVSSYDIKLSGTFIDFNTSALSVPTGGFIVLERQSSGKYLAKRAQKQTVGGVNNVLVVV